MKRLFVCLLVFVVFSLISLRPSWADESPQCEDDPRECFDGTDEDGNIIPKNPDVPKTFDFPYTKVGFIVDFKNLDIVPTLSIQLFDVGLPWAGDLAFDAGVGTSRAFLSITWEFLPIVKAGPLIWGGYNVRDNDYAFGLGVSVLDF